MFLNFYKKNIKTFFYIYASSKLLLNKLTMVLDL